MRVCEHCHSSTIMFHKSDYEHSLGNLPHRAGSNNSAINDFMCGVTTCIGTVGSARGFSRGVLRSGQLIGSTFRYSNDASCRRSGQLIGSTFRYSNDASCRRSGQLIGSTFRYSNVASCRRSGQLIGSTFRYSNDVSCRRSLE